MSYICSIFFALLAGVSIVLSRSVNALLAEKIGALSSSFFNYASGLLASLAFLLLFAPHISPALPQLMKNGNAILLMGGVIGVINIILLNRIVTRIPPLQLTLIVFVAQLASGMLLDYFLLDLFSMRKLIGCSIVVIGLLIHTYAQHYNYFFILLLAYRINTPLANWKKDIAGKNYVYFYNIVDSGNYLLYVDVVHKNANKPSCKFY